MRQEVLLDTGPLVAFLNSRDADHDWVTSQWRQARPPFLTSESVLTEATYVLGGHGGNPDSPLALVERNVIRVDFSLSDNLGPVRRLMKKYRSTPMSLADASLVRMSELHSDSSVFTLDADFKIYRRHGRQVIPLIIPL